MTNKPTLLVLAAGISSRYGSLKQLDSFGRNGETMMDYSIYDAIWSGFGKVVFVIREEFFESFKDTIEMRWKNKIQIEYAFQSIQISHEGRIVTRQKPWGTGHALLSAQTFINEPFCVVNSDDFYGRESFKKMCEFLSQKITPNLYSMVGFELKNTLSENGSVSRGVCSLDSHSMLKKVEEKTKIYRKENTIISEEETSEIVELNGKTFVSMNFWGLHPNIFQKAEIMFSDFISKNFENSKSEFFLPDLVTHGIKNKTGQVQIIPTSTKWFGVTYKEDKQEVITKIHQLIKQKKYPEKL